MANRTTHIRRIPRIGFATLLVVLLIGALLSFCHVWWDIDFSHPDQGDPFWTWDSMVIGFLLGLAVIALGTPVVDEDYRQWFVLRDCPRWPERLRWRVVRQEWFAIVLSLCAIAGLMTYCLRTEVFVGSALFGMLAAILVWLRTAVEPADGNCTPDTRQSSVEPECPPAVQFSLRRLLGLMFVGSLAVAVVKLGLAAHELRNQ